MRIRYFKLAPYTFYTLFTLLTVGLLLHILPLRPRMRPIVWFTRTQPAPTPSAQIVWPMKLGNSRQPYELQLDAIISSDSAVANLATVESNLVLGRNASSTTLTYADLVKIPDDHWLRPHHPNVYFAYPQAFNLTQIYDNLLQQKPIPQASQFQPSFPILCTTYLPPLALSATRERCVCNLAQCSCSPFSPSVLLVLKISKAASISKGSILRRIKDGTMEFAV
ncbi:hypothetical protein EGR_03887 [Echinococcus granulosus]|uniref:Uncharacterized protein n=1 Tax=Echinococcus granulosus TaxID=6210 RepID=W6US63_ECHGR|nr:hypothetical protein EGR_03887 [Echinococcus granulosus]EUB61212.1 hypothetical protein EGR_03887 [Echinococcus granulosus]